MANGTENKGFFRSLSIGNVITIAIIVGGAFSTWVAIRAHLQDENVHLTPEQIKNLTEFTTIADDRIPNIDKNINRIIELEKEKAVHLEQYENLLQEHNDLENKVSRIYKELKDQINE
jgi:hypothetical protein